MIFDKRLIGTWRSDKRRTAQEIRARRDIKAGRKRNFLIGLFGKLVVRFTRTNCYTTFDGRTDVKPLRIAATDADGVVVVNGSSVGDVINHMRFEDAPKNGGLPIYYWICLGQFREYFRRVDRRTVRKRSKRARARRRSTER